MFIRYDVKDTILFHNVLEIDPETAEEILLYLTCFKPRFSDLNTPKYDKSMIIAFLTLVILIPTETSKNFTKTP